MTDSSAPRRPAPAWRRVLGVALAAGLVSVAGCTSSPDDPDVRTDPVPAGALRLVAFDSCAAALAGLRQAASRYVGPWGFNGGGGFAMPSAEDGAARNGVAAQPPAAAGADAAQAVPDAAPAPGGDPSYSGTNTHEAGVDEPDLVKTDGRRIVTVGGGVLRVVDAATKAVTGTVDLGRDADDPIRWQATDLLLYGDHALLLVQDGWYWAGPVGRATDAARPGPQPGELIGPRLMLVDLAAGPRVLSEYTVDGSLVDARQVGAAVRVVVRSAPRLEFPYREEGTDADRLRANREIVNATGIADWLPRYRVTTGNTTSEGRVDCAELTRPASYSGTSMLTVLSFDLGAPALGDGDPLTVVADGETVYGTGTSLYVATDQRWQMAPMPPILPDGDQPVPQEPPQPRTEIHKFDLTQPGQPRYAASGAVDGWLLNQYSMSEWEGHLRVATTTGNPWGGQAEQSESTVHVLEQRGEALARVGSVGGLGAGEQIYSVRFVGPVGYVVTFRQTDPLYTLDLSDPASPEVIGELKITGYSAYLHPLDAGRLLGIGQEADGDGVVQGTQVSLFDVADLTDPTRLAQHHIRYGNSEAEFDPHAFLWWPAQRLLVVPLNVYNWERGQDLPEAGALLLRVDDASITEVTTVSHPLVEQDGYEYHPQIRRSLVVDDTLWTVSDAGLLATSLSSLDTLAWIPFS